MNGRMNVDFVQDSLSAEYFYSCIPGVMCVNNLWIAGAIMVLSVLILFKKHTKQNQDYYQNQIEQLKLQNELLTLKAEYESHKNSNEKNLNELRQHNEKILEEIALIREVKSDYEPERKLSKEEESKINEEIDLAKMKRHRFGELRRSLSSSSIPSEHDEDILPYLTNKIVDSTADRSEEATAVFDYVNSLSTPTPTNATAEQNFSFLKVPEITITDTISFNNYEHLTQQSEKSKV